MAHLADLEYLTTREACVYLRFTGKHCLRHLYRFLDTNGVRAFRSAPRRLRLRRADLDAVLRRGGKARVD